MARQFIQRGLPAPVYKNIGATRQFIDRGSVYSNDLGIPTSLTPGAGSIVFTGYAPAVTVGNTVTPGAGVIVLTGYAPSVTTGTILTPGAGSIVITGLAPSVTTGTTVSPGVGSIVITGYAPAVNAAAGPAQTGAGGPGDWDEEANRRRWLEWTRNRRKRRQTGPEALDEPPEALVAPEPAPVIPPPPDATPDVRLAWNLERMRQQAAIQDGVAATVAQIADEVRFTRHKAQVDELRRLAEIKRREDEEEDDIVALLLV